MLALVPGNVILGMSSLMDFFSIHSKRSIVESRLYLVLSIVMHKLVHNLS
jgi:hypothetical protein